MFCNNNVWSGENVTSNLRKNFTLNIKRSKNIYIYKTLFYVILHRIIFMLRRLLDIFSAILLLSEKILMKYWYAVKNIKYFTLLPNFKLNVKKIEASAGNFS